MRSKGRPLVAAFGSTDSVIPEISVTTCVRSAPPRRGSLAIWLGDGLPLGADMAVDSHPFRDDLPLTHGNGHFIARAPRCRNTPAGHPAFPGGFLSNTGSSHAHGRHAIRFNRGRCNTITDVAGLIDHLCTARGATFVPGDFRAMHAGSQDLAYYDIDVLWLGERDLRTLPLVERLSFLETLLRHVSIRKAEDGCKLPPASRSSLATT